MAILLAAGINATQNRVTLTEPLTAAPGDLFRIDNEVVEFGGYGRMAGGRLVDHSRKIVSFGRGVNGTTAATHIATTAVLRVVDGLVSAVGAPDPFVAPGGASAHADLTGVTANQHHAQLHAAAHAEGEADELTPAAIGAAPAAAGLPAWITLDNTPDAESAEFDGRVIVDAPDQTDAAGEGLLLIKTNQDLVDESNFGIIAAATIAGSDLSDIEADHIFMLTVLGLYINTPVEEGTANIELRARGVDTWAHLTNSGLELSDGPTSITQAITASAIRFFRTIAGEPTVSQQTAASIADLWDAFKAYGLLDDASAAPQAAFVANGSTVDQLRDSLIAAGLMAAS